MDEWFHTADSAEADSMTALQLDYRFEGDTFAGTWWIHLQELGFKHVGRVYELPRSAPRPFSSTNDDHDDDDDDDDNNDDENSNDGYTYDAYQIYAQLDALAVPQVTSAFEALPPDMAATTTAAAAAAAAVAAVNNRTTDRDDSDSDINIDNNNNNNNNNNHHYHNRSHSFGSPKLVEWWRRVRDELIWRKFHKDVEAECRASAKKHRPWSRSGSCSSAPDAPNKRDKRLRTKTTATDTTQSSSSSSWRMGAHGRGDSGAELFLRKRGTTAGRTIGGTKKKRKLEETNNNVNSMDDNDIIFPTLEEYVETAERKVVHQTSSPCDLSDDDSFRTASFEEWRFLASLHHSLLLYGAGSKRELLNRFAQQELEKDGDVVNVEGYDKNVTVEGILQLFVDHWLGGMGPTVDVHRIVHDQPPFYPFRGDPIVVLEAVAIAKKVADVVARTLRPVYLVLHNIDGVGLRNATAQEALAALVDQSQTDCGMRAIRLVTSVDHVNAPALLWDTLSRYKFHFVWKEASTRQPYVEEVARGQADYRSRQPKYASKRSMASAQSGSYLESTEESIFGVLTSLAARHTQVLQQLAFLQLEATQLNLKRQQVQQDHVWIGYDDLLRQCRLKCVVTADSQLRNYLGELMDHGIVERKKYSKGKGGAAAYSIPYPVNILDMILDFDSDDTGK